MYSVLGEKVTLSSQPILTSIRTYVVHTKNRINKWYTCTNGPSFSRRFKRKKPEEVKVNGNIPTLSLRTNRLSWVECQALCAGWWVKLCMQMGVLTKCLVCLIISLSTLKLKLKNGSLCFRLFLIDTSRLRSWWILVYFSMFLKAELAWWIFQVFLIFFILLLPYYGNNFWWDEKKQQGERIRGICTFVHVKKKKSVC